MSNSENTPSFKDAVILYTLSGALVLIGISWLAMGWQVYRNQKD